MTEIKSNRPTLKDYIAVGAIVFLAGGGWIKIESQDERIKKIEQINPELIEYKLTVIDKKVEELKELIIKIPQ